MADVSDVEEALCAQILATVYPNGVAAGSVSGATLKIYRGWPTSKTLNTDLLIGNQTITVFSRRNTSRDTSRYPRVWRTVAASAPRVTASVSTNQVILGGVATAGETVGLLIDKVAYAYSLSAADTLASTAQALASLVPGAVAAGATLTVPVAFSLEARVAGSGVALMETRRQEQGFSVAVWCPSPSSRDLVSSLIDQALSGVDWLALSDGSSGRIVYSGTEEVDTAENANLYRRNLDYKIEYPTTMQMTAPQMLFGTGLLAGNPSALDPAPDAEGDDPAIPSLGAIRFDAWYDPANIIDQQCAAALSVPAYADRLPCNATVANSLVSWPRATQATIDFEITAALVAGLSFWAFDSYSPDDTLGLGLQLYLTSSLRSKLRFCMLGQTSNWGQAGQDQPSLLRDIAMMTQPGYMTVLDDRPLYLVLDASATQLTGLPPGGVTAAISLVRAQVLAAGGNDPYVVWLSAAAMADYSNIDAARSVGADAAAAYCTPRLNGTVQPASALFAAAEADWVAREAADYPMVPTAMTGWDPRPLIQTPQSFYPLQPGASLDDYYQKASDAELTDHIVALSETVRANRGACPAQIGLIYAWNELAEGGWLVPTYAAGGSDMGRVAAVGAACVQSASKSNGSLLKFTI